MTDWNELPEQVQVQADEFRPSDGRPYAGPVSPMPSRGNRTSRTSQGLGSRGIVNR